MKRYVGFLVIGLILCSGQMCGGPPPQPKTEPADQAITSPIPEGIYTGTVTEEAKTYSAGVLFYDDIYQLSDGVIIGPDGIPEWPDGSPYEVGSKGNRQTGTDRVLELTIRNISTSSNGVLITFEAHERYTVDGQPIVSDGEAFETLTLQSDGTLDYLVQLTTNAFIYGVNTSVGQTWTGTLSKPGQNTAPQVTSPIPEGLYAGSITSRLTGRYINEPIPEKVSTDQLTQAFGPDGLPLTKTNAPIYIGYEESTDLGAGSMVMKVDGIRSVQNGIEISFTVSMDMTANGQTATAGGSATADYKLNADGSLTYTFQMAVLSVFPDGATLSQSGECSGVLRR